MDYKKAWEELQIKDDFLFAKVMRDKKICAALLEKLLGTKIWDIVYLEEEKRLISNGTPRASDLTYM